MTLPATQLNLFGARYDRRFLEDYVGRAILSDPQVALIELIANAWDANADSVKIDWPSEQSPTFAIEDNGCGLTEDEFERRWMVLSYDRIKAQGMWAEIPANAPEGMKTKKRRVFGRNGKGRHGAFCFSDDGYNIDTWKNGKRISFRVYVPADGTAPISFKKSAEKKCAPDISGTKIYCRNAKSSGLTADDIRTIIGLRFLSDPDFKISVDGQTLTFQDVPEENITRHTITLPDGDIQLLQIDVMEADRTTKQHGIAWQVHGRLVGNVEWNSLGDRAFIDGRKTAAKRFSFIVKADYLADQVESDWMGFKKSSTIVDQAVNAVSAKIKELLLEASKQQREDVFAAIVDQNEPTLKNLATAERVSWASAVKRIQQECPSLSENDVETVSAILAKMELARSKYGLLHKLGACSTDDFDALDQILTTWNVETARVVLNELETRLKLIDELANKVNDRNTDEVRDLQPLFEKGLWIFGPEYEAVGFSSNRTMATIIREKFKKQIPGSQNRPDFLITLDGSMGFYSYPEFDHETGNEVGTSRLAIVELKAPAVPISEKEMAQPMKYVNELLDKGLIQESTKINCFVLGRTVHRHANRQTKHGENIMVSPFPFEVILSMAKNRTHRLYDQIKASAPFLQEEEPKILMADSTGAVVQPLPFIETFPKTAAITA